MRAYLHIALFAVSVPALAAIMYLSFLAIGMLPASLFFYAPAAVLAVWSVKPERYASR